MSMDTIPQAKPTSNGGQRVVDHVVHDLLERAAMGRKKYGFDLETNNGRNALIDAYQEALDLCMYLKQRLLEEAEPGIMQSGKYTCGNCKRWKTNLCLMVGYSKTKDIPGDSTAATTCTWFESRQ